MADNIIGAGREMTTKERETLEKIQAEAKARLGLKEFRSEAQPLAPMGDVVESLEAKGKALTKKQKKLVDNALEIQSINAAYAGTVGFTSPLLILATLPHSEPKDEDGKPAKRFSRRSGNFTLTIEGGEAGIPYGPWPRLILIWLITEAILTESKEIFLGNSVTEFMRKLGIEADTRIRKRIHEQLLKIAGCRVTCTGYKPGKKRETLNIILLEQISIVFKALLWWDQKKEKDSNQGSLFTSSMIFTEEFYQALQASPVPLDVRATNALRGSTMAMDIYAWLTFSMFNLQEEITVSWEKLYAQFGADYTRLRAFRDKFIEQLKEVLVIYNTARVSIDKKAGITLKPSPPHVKALPKRVKLSTKNDGK